MISLYNLNEEAKKYKDIEKIMLAEDKYYTIMIVCKPNFNTNEVIKFIKENLPFGVEWEIYEETDKYINEDPRQNPPRFSTK